MSSIPSGDTEADSHAFSAGLKKGRHGPCEPWRPPRANAAAAASRFFYSATPLSPFGDPGIGVIKYGKTDR
jgi:hypothetical protein